MLTKKIGKVGEEIAEKFLKEKGYQILERNYSFQIPGNPQRGEVDIIAKKGGLISFVEVKFLRKSNPLIAAEEKVNFSKKKKLITAAESWLIKNKISLNSKWQIDVLAIEIKKGKPKISYFPNAVSDFPPSNKNY